MRKVIKEFNVYTIDELEKINKDGYNFAMNLLIENTQRDFWDFWISDYIKTLETIEKIFKVDSSKWDVDGYNAYYRVIDCYGYDINTYKRTYSFVVNNIMPEIKDFDFSLTGFCADYEPLTILEKFVNGKLIFKTLTDLIESMCLSVLTVINEDYNAIENDIPGLKDNANGNDFEFLENGHIYND